MKRIPLAIQLIIALILGTLVGLWLGKQAEPLGEVGLVVIRLLKALATPLIFFAIIDAFSQTAIPGKQGLKLVVITSVNASMAVLIALTLIHFVPLDRLMDLEKLKASIAAPSPAAINIPSLNLQSILQGFVPTSLFEPFVNNNIIPVILLALCLGIALRKVKSKEKNAQEIAAFEKIIAGCFKLITIILGWVIYLIPLAAFCVIAKTVGQSGFEVFRALGVFVGIVAFGLAVHVFIYYGLMLFALARVAPGDFFKKGSEPLMTALGTGSSLATLPVTLRTLQEKMKISPQSSRLAACIGTNLNNDGIILYEAVAALFIAQLHGVPMDISQQVAIGLVSVAAAAGIAGIPEAGFITLSLVVGAVGLPLATVPLLLPVDWFLGRLRAATNVTSDMMVATLLDKA